MGSCSYAEHGEGGTTNCDESHFQRLRIALFDLYRELFLIVRSIFDLQSIVGTIDTTPNRYIQRKSRQSNSVQASQGRKCGQQLVPRAAFHKHLFECI